MDLKQRLDEVDKKIIETIKQKAMVIASLIHLQSQKVLLEDLVKESKEKKN